MKNSKLIVVLLPLVLGAEDYEDKFYKDQNHHPSNIAFHADLGYGAYRIAFHSSEIDSVIDYDIAEVTLGSSLSYDRWMWGIYGKFIVDEIESNTYIGSSSQALGNHAEIDKNEFGLYGNYTLVQNSSSSWMLNGIYRYVLLDAVDSYHAYHHYRNRFRYQTQGVALSLVYAQQLSQKSTFFFNAGLSYSQAMVEISQQTDEILHDSHVDDERSTMGGRFSFGYSYRVLPRLFFNIRSSYWYSSFSKLKVSSRVGDRLPTGTLTEDTRALYGGLTLSF